MVGRNGVLAVGAVVVDQPVDAFGFSELGDESVWR
jgi:hypothetical protein